MIYSEWYVAVQVENVFRCLSSHVWRFVLQVCYSSSHICVWELQVSGILCRSCPTPLPDSLCPTDCSQAARRRQHSQLTGWSRVLPSVSHCWWLLLMLPLYLGPWGCQTGALTLSHLPLSSLGLEGEKKHHQTRHPPNILNSGYKLCSLNLQDLNTWELFAALSYVHRFMQKEKHSKIKCKVLVSGGFITLLYWTHGELSSWAPGHSDLCELWQPCTLYTENHIYLLIEYVLTLALHF